MKLFTLIIVFLLPIAVTAQSKGWQPVPPNEIAMKSPQVEPNADAEVLFWEVRIGDDYIQRAGWQSVLNHHVRIKIFTDRGRELYSKIDITYGNLTTYSARALVKDVFARTIKPDGTIVEVKPEDIFDRDVVRGSGIKLKAKSFAVPGIGVGSIIEYKWKEVREDTYNYSRIELAREIPVQYVKYYIRPVMNTPFGMRLHSINTAGNFVSEGKNVYSTTMRNVPAVVDEPEMPPEYEIKPWVLVWYDVDRIDQSAESYWRERGREAASLFKESMKGGSDIKAAALKAVGSATDQNEMIKLVYDYCLANVKDVSDDASGLTPDQLKAIKFNYNPSETLSRATGTRFDMAMLFGAMLTSVGFEVRVAGVTKKTDPTFFKSIANDYFIRSILIAVRSGNGWKFIDFDNRHLPFGMVAWEHEGRSALIYDDDPSWQTTPTSVPSQSVRKRVAAFTLKPDGTLEGDARFEFTGHHAEYYREYLDDESSDEREKYVKQMIKSRVGDQADVTGILVENLTDYSKPLIIRFQLKVPAYTERTGKRMFLIPIVFEKTALAKFIAGTRRYDIVFKYPWTEDDEMTIELPAGFDVESLESPPSINDTWRGVDYATSFKLSEDKKKLIVRRIVSVGTGGELSFSKTSYQRIKGLFESIKSSDGQAVVLREK